MNTLDFLARFENDCLSLYRTLAAKTASTELKELYGLLADTRTRHLNLLESLKKTVRHEDVESEYAERAARVTNGFRMALTARDLSTEMRNDHDAFTHVIKGEEEMIRLCEGMAKTEAGEGVKALLNWFVTDEKRHLEEVEGIYEFMEAPHNYLVWGEFSNLRAL